MEFASCFWNGKEIVEKNAPSKAIAEIVCDTPEKWGFLFAAAPDMYLALKLLLSEDSLDYIDSVRLARYAIKKIEGR